MLTGTGVSTGGCVHISRLRLRRPKPTLHSEDGRALIMADAVLNDLTSGNLFDLSGVVAVVTGGGTVSVVANIFSDLPTLADQPW